MSRKAIFVEEEIMERMKHLSDDDEPAIMIC